MVIVRRPDGTVIVEHADGTRLTTYFVENSQGQDSETGEEEVRIHDPIQYVKVIPRTSALSVMIYNCLSGACRQVRRNCGDWEASAPFFVNQ